MIIREGIAEAAGLLAHAGIEAASREAWLLLGSVMGLDRATLLAHAGDVLSPADRSAFFRFVERRVRREPAAQILGEKEFWSLPFTISKDVLCPRPDSETLVEMALDLLKERAAGLDRLPRILDLGAGSGCLVLALLHELSHAEALGVDRSPEALAVARVNAERLGLSSRIVWLCTDWGSALVGAFDLIISNPPYIESGAWPDLAPEIRLFEPATALTAGEDGLDAYRHLAGDVQRLLAPTGFACFEHGLGQGDAVAGLMSEAGLACIAKRQDLAGIERCLAVERLP